MPYCTIDDVQALIKSFTITATTKVSVDEVNNDIIPEVCRRIDERLGKYYQTPITGTDALITVNRIARYLAAAEVLNRLYLGEAPSASEQATQYIALAEADLDRITSGEVILTDAPTTDDTPEPLSKKIGSNVMQSTLMGQDMWGNPYRTSGPIFRADKRW
jgi:hypothetical protein